MNKIIFPFKEKEIIALNDNAQTDKKDDKTARTAAANNTVQAENVTTGDKTSDKVKLEEELSSLKKLYDDTSAVAPIPDYGAELLEKDNTSYENIEKQARSFADGVYNEKSDALKNSNDEKKAQFADKIEQAKQELSADEQKIANDYNNAKSSAEKQAIKRGIARSSVIFNLLKDFDEQKLDKTADRQREARDGTAKIQSDISNLDSELKQALSKLDMQKAVDINDKIEELKSQLDKKNNEIIKYNNELKEKIAEYKNQLLNSEDGKEINKNIEAEKKKYMFQMSFKIIDYYNKLSKKEAMEDFAASDYGKLLDSDAYLLVNNYLKSKA